MLFLNLMFNLPIPLFFFFSFLSVTTASTSTCCFQISGLAHSLVSLPQKSQIAWLPSLAQASPLSRHVQPQLPAFVNKPWLAWTRSSVPVFCIRISWPALSQSDLASEWGMSGNRYWLWKCSLSHSKYPGWRGSATSPSHLNLPKYSCCSPPVSVYPASLSCPRLWSTAAVGSVSLLKSLWDFSSCFDHMMRTLLPPPIITSWHFQQSVYGIMSHSKSFFKTPLMTHF